MRFEKDRRRPLAAWLPAIPLLFLTLLPAGSLFAASSWFSGARFFDDRGQPVDPEAKATSSLAVFDVTVSLHDAPAGDDDPDNDMASEEQTKYETIVEHWADAVCEQSNGRHRLGTVRIFRNGDFSSRADVVWQATPVRPSAHPSGFGKAGWHILLADVFPDGSGPGMDKNMLDDLVGTGYTLGHEWGHYVYGLYDEYEGDDPNALFYFPRQGDTPVDQAIMSNQWRARGGSFRWLNHSTANNYQAATGQGRAYGASGWDVLVRPTSQDPRDGLRKTLPERVQYTNLAGAQPTAADSWYRIELPAARATCRAELEIVWMTEESLEIQVVIDRSGSMAGTPITNARQAAKNLVDVVPEGETALGVVSFASSVSTNVGIRQIPDPGAAVKNAIKAAIDNIAASGVTAMFDGAIVALDGLEQYQAANGTSANRVVFLLSDGGDNSSSNSQASVTSAYTAAQVPLVTFGYGSFAPNGVLRQLAESTNGEFFASPTTLAEIQNAFLSAITSVSSSVSLSSIRASAPPLATNVPIDSFQVDSTLESLSVLVNHDQGVDALALSLAGPSGVVPGVGFACEASTGGTSCVGQVGAAAVAAAGRGGWVLRATNRLGFAVDVSGTVVASPSQGRTYDIAAESVGGATVRYPEPIVLTAAIGRGRLIARAGVSATVTDPQGNRFTFPMRDDGLGGDGAADDGVYTRILNYFEDGTYAVEITADNAAGTAVFARAGYQPAPAVDGGEAPLEPPQPISERFERRTQLQLTVDGFSFDDHANFPGGTSIVADNRDVAGRIDFAGDVDYFRIGGFPRQQPLAVRVSDLALGMRPVLTLFQSDGRTEIRSVDLSSSASSRGYVFTVLQPSQITGSSVVARVRDASASSPAGSYRISAGAAIASDVLGGPATSCTPTGSAMCLNRDRFRVEVDWRDFEGNTGSGRVVPAGSDDSGLFYFFDPDNWEMLVKVLDGCSVNGRFWVFSAATTNVEYTLRVTDTVTGASRVHFNPLGRSAAAVTDTDAFRSCPGAPRAGAAGSEVVETVVRLDAAPEGVVSVPAPDGGSKQGSCSPSASDLCLGGQRFRVEVDWRDFEGNTGSARVVPVGSADSGLFWFFDHDNWEMLVKVLDGCGVNGRYWVFSAATTNVEYTLRVTDTMTGRSKSYFNPLGRAAAAITDTSALAVCP